MIAGAAGSLRRNAPKSGTRPTSDRVREAIFSALESWGMVDGTRVLDLYAGSGALGLEAASRGASEVTLVEKHGPAAQIASSNAKIVLGAFRGATAPTAEVIRASVQSTLDTMSSPGDTGRFDVILLDPPYDVGEAELAANLAAAAPLLALDGVLLVERSSRSPEPAWPSAVDGAAAPAGLTLLREKRYGETVLWWAERADRESDTEVEHLTD
ncbi:MAG: methyltransferase [Microbacteriaceae bacterium]|nr:methyltransferase [Microbacteriaceae bacterium]